MSIGGIWIQKFFRPRIASGQRWAGVLLILAGLSSLAAFGLRSQTREAHAQDLSSPVTQRPICH
jgi:hypothetical protein